MFNKRLLARSLLLVFPIALVAGCQTTLSEADSARISSAGESAAQAIQTSQEAMLAIGELRTELVATRREVQRAAEAAERAAAEAKAAADKADRIFQRTMRK